MTYDQYIKNPMGGSVVTNRQVLMDMYNQKWNDLLVRENGKINYYLYRDKGNYYLHFKIPSEVVPKFYYDTVALFYIDKHKTSGTLPSSLNMKFNFILMILALYIHLLMLLKRMECLSKI